MSTTWYVSNAATNGYVVGNNSNNGLTPGTAKLTIQSTATGAGSAGDTINGNIGIYAEDDGSNHGLNLTAQTSITIQLDPTLVGLGTMTIRGNGSTSTDVVNVPSSSNALGFVFNNITFDGQNLGINIISPHNNTAGGVTFNSCSFKNIASGSQSAIGAFSSTGNVCLLNKCTIDSTVNRCIAASDFGGSGSLTIKGGSYSPVNGLFASTWPNANAANLVVTSAADLSRPQISGCASGAFALKGTGTTSVAISNCDFSNNFSDLFIQAATPMTGLSFVHFSGNTSAGTYTEPSVFIQNATCTDIQLTNNTCSNSIGFASVAAELASNVVATGNNVTLSGTATIGVQVGPTGTGAKVHDNTGACSSSAAAIMFSIGLNGPNVDASNSTPTTTHKLFDQTSDTFLATSFTTSSLTVAGRASYLSGCNVAIQKTGAPTGSVTCKVYSDTGSNAPNASLETSIITVAGSVVTGSAQTFFFEFASHTQLTAATKYWLVFTVTGGAIDAANYYQFGENTTVTGGSVSASADASSWVNDATHALIFNLFTGSFGSTDGQLYSNTLNCTSAGSATVHGVLAGTTVGTKIYNNTLIGGSIGCLSKDGYTTSIYDNFYFCPTGGSTENGIYVKGSHSCTVYQNTVIQSSGSGSLCAAYGENFDSSLGVNQNPSGTTVKNNIFLANTASSTTPAYNLSANTLGVFPTPTIDFNVVFGTNVVIEHNRYSTWAAWQAASFDTHGVNQDPGLVNESNPAVATDFRVALSTSPAVGAGTNLTASVPLDHFGNYQLVAATIGGFSFYTGELFCRATASSTVYAEIFNSAGLVFNFTTLAFEGYLTANLANYTRQLTQIGTASGIYVGNFPYTLPQGVYLIKYALQAGGSPAEDDSQVTDPLSRASIWWSGTAIYVPSATDTSGRPQANMVQAGGTTVGAGAIPNAAAGAANGLHILGTNTGPYQVNGGVTYANAGGNAFTLTASGSNGHGLAATGNGSGDGVHATGGATAHGMQAIGGATSGSGFKGIAPTSGSGASFTGAGAFHGLHLIAGATGNGFTIVAGASSGMGVFVTTTSGDGISVLPTAGNAITATGQGSGKHGMALTGGTGSGTGLAANVTGTLTGNLAGNITGSVNTVTTPVIVSNTGLPSAAFTVVSSLNPSTVQSSAGSAQLNFYVGSFIVFTSGILQGQMRKIASYAPGSFTFTLTQPFAASPTMGDTFDVLGGPTT